MARFRRVVIVLSGLLLAIGGCSPESQVIELRTGRSQVRDVVRAAALLPDGSPVFERLDTSYEFTEEGFHIEGIYVTSDGSERDGFLDLGFGVVGGELSVTIVDHDVTGLEDHLTTIEQALTTELARSVQSAFSEDILEYQAVEVLADNVLEITLRLDRPFVVSN